MRFLGLSLVSLALLIGCSAGGGSSSSANGGSEGGAGGADGTGQGGAGGGSVGQGGDINLGGGFGSGGGGTGGGEPAPAEVFAHSAGTLFKLDPITKVVTTVGAFNGCNGSVIDIAIDKNGLMFGATFGGLFRIDKANASCTSISTGSYPNSLSFVPKGTVDPNQEALVGYVGGSYVRIDTTTGAVTPIGTLGNNYSSSGDIVSVIGGGTYLTVNGNGCGDCIVEVNPTTGSFVKLIGPLGQSSVFGLAFWGGVAYGFNDGGKLFSIDLSNGVSTLIPMPNAPPGLSFWGAGSTTAAPIVIPK